MARDIFSAIPLDWIILGAIVIIVALDTLRSGLGRAMAFAVAFPLATVLFSLTVDAAVLESASGMLASTSMQLGLLLVLFVALFFLVRRMGLDYVSGGVGEPVQAIISGTAVAVIFLCVWLATPVLSDWWAFGTQIQIIFDESFRFWWLLASYAALAFARG